MIATLSRRAALTACMVITLGCASSTLERETAAQDAVSSKSDEQLIDHVLPRRDSQGPPPSRFEWTAANGAEEYTIGLWNEADTMLWRQPRIREPHVVAPKELELEPGTYYWSVVGLRDGRVIAESGLSAFVVMPGP